MKEITLKPIYDYKAYSDQVTRQLIFELYYMVFRPLFDTLGTKPGERIKSNDVEVKGVFKWNKVGSELARSLLSGNVSYQDPFFMGIFNAAISRELRSYGASFNQTRKAYKLPLGKMPLELRGVISQSHAKQKQTVEELLKQIDAAKEKMLSADVGKYAIHIVGELDKQFTKTVKVVPESIEVPMDLSDHSKKKIQEDYVTNLNLHINGWKEEQIERLREKIQENVSQGFRADKMAKTLEAEYGLSASRAKFISKQETSILVSKFREARYEEAGLTTYIWQTSHDERVRSDHKDLNGKRFSYDNPPIVDKDEGKRANPGEDFGCRCVAVPVIKIRS